MLLQLWQLHRKRSLRFLLLWRIQFLQNVLILRNFLLLLAMGLPLQFVLLYVKDMLRRHEELRKELLLLLLPCLRLQERLLR
jgi:hypothetical protein